MAGLVQDHISERHITPIGGDIRIAAITEHLNLP